LKNEEHLFTENDQWVARFIRLKIISLFDILVIVRNEQGLLGRIRETCFPIADFQSYISFVVNVLFG
jgi:hypothetical protein